MVFWYQLEGLVFRNFLLKLKNYGTTIGEILLPVILILSIIPHIHFESSSHRYDSSTIKACFLPNTTDVTSIAILFKSNFEHDISNKKINLFPSTSSEDTAELLTHGLCDIVFSFSDDINRNGSYEIRTVNDRHVSKLDFSCIEKCKNSLIVAAHKAIDTALIQFWSENYILDLEKALSSLQPTINITNELSLVDKQKTLLFPIYLVTGFSFLVSSICLEVAYEKETKIKETMIISGLNLKAYWFSWFIVEFIVMGLAISLQIGALYIFHVFRNTTILLFFSLIMSLYGCSAILFSFMMTPFFKSAKTAAAISGFLTVIMSLSYLTSIFMSDSMSKSMLLLVSFLSPSAFTLSVQKICEINMKDDFNYNYLMEGQFSVIDGITMLIVDILLYGVLTYVLDSIISEESLGFWKRRFCCHVSGPGIYTYNPVENEDVESVPEEFIGKDVINIRHLKKIYNKGRKDETVAIDDFSLDIYEGQITAFIGHNGSGKTSLIQMLTGRTDISSGAVKINGKDIKYDSKSLQDLRATCGICPQKNILFDKLSPYDHLKFYAKLKNVPRHKINEAVNTAIERFKLTEFQSFRCKDLSCGQKRKVCVAIAMMGYAYYVFLDEPTYGMDPKSRRELWTELKQLKKRRVIFFTTHYMEEADILADRKVIICKGKVRCAGSSIFLKKKFGIGYHLRMAISPHCDSALVITRIQQHNPNATCTRPSSEELIITLPSMESSQLTTLLLDLENFSADLNILNYGISLPTLEEVFHKLNIDEGKDENKEKEDEEHLDEFREEIPLQDNDLNSIELFHTQKTTSYYKTWCAFLVIRMRIIFRHVLHVIMTILLPMFYVFILWLFIVFYQIKHKFHKNEETFNPGTHSLKQVTLINVADSNVHTDSIERALNSYGFDTVVFNSTNFSTYQNISPVSAVIWAYNISNEEVNISWQWYYYPFNRLTKLSVLNLMANVIWNTMNQNNNNQSEDQYNIKHISMNLHEMTHMHTKNVIFSDFQSMFIMCFLIMGIINVTVMIGIEVLSDKKESIRTQLHISGLSPSIYWTVTLTAHCTFCAITEILLCILTNVMEIPYYENQIIPKIILWTLIFYNIPGSLLYIYVLTCLFKSPHTAYSVLPIMIIWTTLFSTVVTLMTPYDSFIHFAMYILCPFHIITGTSVRLARPLYENEFSSVESYFTWKSNVPHAFIAVTVGTIIYAWLLKLIEMKKINCARILTSTVIINQEETSEEEENNIPDDNNAMCLDKMEENNVEVLQIKNLTKVYTPKCAFGKKFIYKTAVKNLSFSIKPGEVFGFLGPNGAGKTSTVKIIIGEENATSGKVMVGNDLITNSNAHVVTNIGYCPQQDALWKRITLKEHLEFYAILNGVESQRLEEFCKTILETLDLKEHRHKKIMDLSIGTKRKLSCALAMFGPPKLLLLDEPTSGIDPKSRKILWDFIRKSFSSNISSAALITTHSMEEAEALCTRIGILVNGSLRCLGSVQQLKEKYAKGYFLQIKLPDNLEDRIVLEKKIEDFVSANFPKAKRLDYFLYKVPKEAVFSIADAFRSLETAKMEFKFTDYTFSQATFEQVFLEITKEQTEDDNLV